MGGGGGGWLGPRRGAPKERERPSFISSLQQLPVFLFFLFLVVNVSSESIFTQNAKNKQKKKEKTSFIGLGPCIPLFFPFKKSFLFCF